jgi:hypothetical protein
MIDKSNRRSSKIGSLAGVGSGIRSIISPGHTSTTRYIQQHRGERQRSHERHLKFHPPQIDTTNFNFLNNFKIQPFSTRTSMAQKYESKIVSTSPIKDIETTASPKIFLLQELSFTNLNKVSETHQKIERIRLAGNPMKLAHA